MNYFLSMRIVLNSSNSVDPDEMPHDAAFYLGLHCQSTCLGVSSIQRVNVSVLAFVQHLF